MTSSALFDARADREAEALRSAALRLDASFDRVPQIVVLAPPTPGTRRFAEAAAMQRAAADMDAAGTPVADLGADDLARAALRRLASPAETFDALRQRLADLVAHVASLDRAGRDALRHALDRPSPFDIELVTGALAFPSA